MLTMIWKAYIVLWTLSLLNTGGVTSADVDYSVQEQSSPGHLIGNIPDSIGLANLVSQSSLPYMKYSFLNTDSSVMSLFTLDDKTGDLRVSSAKILDREVICQFNTMCVLELQVAIQSTHTQFFRKVLVSIDVVDINDHAPQFQENFTALVISESVQIPSSFPLPSALDKDTGANNSLQSYEIVPKDGPFELTYSKSNPNLMLRVVKELDHETRDLYSVRIIARDGGDPPREGVLNADIHVSDVNDNAPKFTQENYAKVVDETVKQGSLLLSLTATDADSDKNGQVRYRLSPQQPLAVLNTFSVDPLSGELRLTGDFQSADTELYTIEVEASDLADQPFTTKTTITITVEDTINSRPKILLSTLSSNNFSSISEYANMGVAVAHIQVKDTDRGPNGIVHCNLSRQGYFELQSYDIKEYKVIVARPLDREAISMHNVTIECFDAGLPSLSVAKSFQIQVTDENDNSPQFDDRYFYTTIPENNKVGEEILIITAVDQDDPNTGNGQVTYSLQDVSDGEFLINPDTGAIKAMTSFDYELRHQINFTVMAEDKGVPRRSAKAAIGISILDINDQVPYFAQSRFTITVSEYASPGSLIGEITAFDFEQGKNGQFDITFIPGSGRSKMNPMGNAYESQVSSGGTSSNYQRMDDENLPFKVRPNGTVILLNDLDYETRNFFEFEVRVTDKGDPPLSDTATVVAEVTDENDNAPNILHPNTSEVTFTALTGSGAPETLLSFDVSDRDSGGNSLLVYTVTARNDSGRFEIDEMKGEVKRARTLTGKDAGIYKLSVMVRDSGVPPLSDVRTLLIHVTGGNGTASGSGSSSDQYIVISLTLVCVTILLSVTIVLVIVIMRRLDRRRKSNTNTGPGGPMHIQNTRVVTAFVDPIKLDNFRNESSDRGSGEYRDDDGSFDEKKMNDSHFGFNSSSGSINKSNAGDSSYQTHQVNNLNLPTSASREGDIDLEALQLHQVLLQTYQDSQAVAVVPEDGASDSSGETITSDSGRGGSDEDISNANTAAGHSLDDSRAGHNGSFQSNTSTFGNSASLKSSVKDPVRSSSRKHVTFKDMERFRNSVRSQSGVPEQSGAHSSELVSSGAGSSMTQMAGPLQKQQLSSFSGSVSPRGHQNPLSEMNIPVAVDNSNIRTDSPRYNSFGGYSHGKNSPRGIPTGSTFGDGRGRDSPRLQTFPTAAPPQQPFQSQNSPRLPFYDGEDSIPSPMPRESPREWKASPRLATPDNHSNSNNSNSSQQGYMHMSSPRDRLKQQQQQNYRSQSPQVFGNPNLPPHCDSPSSSSARNSPRNVADQRQMGPNALGLSANDNKTMYNMNSPRDNGHPSQTTTFNPKFNPSLPSPRNQSPAPLLPPRDAKMLSDPNLLSNDLNKYVRNPLQHGMTPLSGDWNNESIATTEDLDDQRSTTTSGSYTIDNEDEYLPLEYKPKDVVV